MIRQRPMSVLQDKLIEKATCSLHSMGLKVLSDSEWADMYMECARRLTGLAVALGVATERRLREEVSGNRMKPMNLKLDPNCERVMGSDLEAGTAESHGAYDLGDVDAER